MADILQHPLHEDKANEATFYFPEGSSVSFANPEGQVMTRGDALVMLERAKTRIMKQLEPAS